MKQYVKTLNRVGDVLGTFQEFYPELSSEKK